ncbi:YfiR family protein [Massilia sp. B-10]|nr:YfiR family protein [Massilia sp. B-10]
MAALKRMPCWWHWPGWLAWLVLAVFGLARAEAPAAHAAPLERQVQAAYLVKFAGFTEWPEASFARPDSVLQIGVVGRRRAGRFAHRHGRDPQRQRPSAGRAPHRAGRLPGLACTCCSSTPRSTPPPPRRCWRPAPDWPC